MDRKLTGRIHTCTCSVVRGEQGALNAATISETTAASGKVRVYLSICGLVDLRGLEHMSNGTQSNPTTGLTRPNPIHSHNL